MRQSARRQGSLSPMVERWKRLMEAADRWVVPMADHPRRAPCDRRASREHDGADVASSMAYFAILSLFQVVVLGVIVFSLVVGEGEARRIVIGRLETALPLEPGTMERHRREHHRVARRGHRRQRGDPGVGRHRLLRRPEHRRRSRLRHLDARARSGRTS